MINPVCSKCMYLINKPETFRKCPAIPIIHRNMCCSNPNNEIKDNVSGDSYRPYCEEVNRHAECLFYYPKELQGIKDIFFNEESNIVRITGKNVIIATTDGTTPVIEKPLKNNIFDESTGLYCVEIPLEHTCLVKAACTLEDVISDIRESYIEISDIPSIEFDKETNTVSIKSYNKIFYTIDGSDVSEDSLVYDKPFIINHNTTIKTCSFARDGLSVQIEQYCATREKPVINFNSETNTVSIESDDTILYSTDGSNIYDDSEEYTEPFEIDKNTIIKAACIVEGELSEQAELDCRVPVTPVIKFDSQTNTVSITADNRILYTTDGSDVKKKDSEYETPFKISKTTIIKAVSIVNNKVSEQAELICNFTE